MKDTFQKLLKRALGLMLICCIVFQFFVPLASAVPQISLDRHTLTVAASAGSASVGVTCNIGVFTVSVSSDGGWLSATKGGSGITVSWTQNNTTSSRTGRVTVKALEEASDTLTVTQNPGSNTITVTPSSLSFSAAGDTKTFKATSSLGYNCSVTAIPEWLTVTPTSVSSGSSFTVTASLNTTAASRDGTITVTSSGASSKTVTVTQEAPTLSVSKTKLFPAAAAGYEEVTVTTNVSPSYSSDSSWLHPSWTGSTQSVGDNRELPNEVVKTLKIAWDANGGDTRTGTVTVSAGGVTRQITVNQAGNSLSVDPTSLSFPAGGATQSVAVTADSGLTSTVSSCPNWLTYSVGSNSIGFTAGSNDTGSQRSGSITIKNGTKTQSVSVSQSAHTLAVTPTQKTFSAAGGTETVTVSTSGGYPSYSKSANWIHVQMPGTSKGLETGDGIDALLPYTVTVECDRNEGGSQRTGTVTFSAGGASGTLAITQEANVLTLSKTSLSYPAQGGSETLTASASALTRCTVTSCPEWITASPSEVVSGGSFTFSASSNSTDLPRTGTITIASGTVTENITVSQEVCTLTLSSTSETVPALAGSFQVTATTNNLLPQCSTAADWLHVSTSQPRKASDGGASPDDASYLFTVAYDVNIGPARTGVITFTAGNKAASLTVVQAEGANEITLNKSSLSFPAEGDFRDVIANSSLGIDCTVSEMPDWITASPTSVESGGTFRFTVSSNMTGAERNDSITITSPGASPKTITVSQNAHTLAVSPKTISAPAASGTASVTVTLSGLRPSFTTDADWLTVSYPDLEQGVGGASPQDNQSVRADIHYASNLSGEARTGHVTFSFGGKSATVNVLQAGNVLTLDPDSLNFPAEGGPKTVAASLAAYGVGVQAYSWPSWMSASVNGWVFTFVAQPNDTGTERSGEIVFLCNDITRIVPVTQEAPTLSVTPKQLSALAAEGYSEITVSSSLAPSVDTDQSWLHPSWGGETQSEGDNRELPNEVVRTLRIAWDANGGNARVGTVTVSAGGLQKTITVNQAGNVLTLSESSLHFAAGETAYQDVTASSASGLNCSITSSPDWIQYTQSGNTFSIRALNNTSGGPREDTITFKSGSAEATLSVFQRAYTMSISSTEENISAAGATLTITATSSFGLPNVSENETWIRCEIEGIAKGGGKEAPQGDSTSTVHIYCDQNGGAARDGTVTFSAYGVSCTLTIHQAKNELTLSKTTILYPGEGSSQTVKASSSALMRCTVTSCPDWITSSPIEVSSGGTFTFTATSNSTASERTGTITITSGTVSAEITVRQVAHTLNLSSSSGEFDAAGQETISITVRSTVINPHVDTAGNAWIHVELPDQISGAPEQTKSSLYSNTAVIGCDPNPGLPRRGKVNFSSGGVTKSYTVIQNGNEIIFSLDSVVLFAEGGEHNARRINAASAAGAPVQYVAGQSLPDWLHVSSVTNGTSDAPCSVSFWADENSSNALRSCSVNFTCSSGAVSKQLAVTQLNHSLVVFSTDREVPASETEFRVEVKASGNNWSVVSNNAEWLRITSIDKGSNMGMTRGTQLPSFTVKCLVNQGAPRTGSITVSMPGCSSYTFSVTQDENQLILKKDDVTFAQEGETVKIAATSTAAIPVEIDQDSLPEWITEAEVRGAGYNYVISLTADKNISCRPLVGVVAVRSGDKEATISVNQPFECVQKDVKIYLERKLPDGFSFYRLAKTDTAQANYNGYAFKVNRGTATIPYAGGPVTFSADGYVSSPAYDDDQMIDLKAVYLSLESDEPVITNVWVNGTDVMHSRLGVGYGEDCFIRANVEWGSNEIKELKLWQPDSGSVNISENGSVCALADEFDLTSPVYITASYNSSGSSYMSYAKSRPLYFSLEYELPPGYSDNVSFGFGGSTSREISIGPLGNIECSTSLPSIVPVCYKMQNGKFLVAAGFPNNLDWGGMSDVKSIVRGQSLLPDVGKGSFGPLPATFFLGGFIEGYFDRSAHRQITDSGLYLSTSGGVSWSNQILMYPVPVYVEVELSGGADAQLGFGISESGGTGVSGSVGGDICLKGGVGLGISGLIGISGGVFGAAHLDLGLVSSSINSAFLTLTVGGYIKATAVIFEKEWDFNLPPFSWNLKGKGPNSNPQLEALKEAMQGMLDEEGYKRQNIDYLLAGSAFRTKGDPTAFVNNAYQGAAPQLLTWDDGTKLAVWLGYDLSRNGYDGLCLYAAYFNGSSWSEPFQVENDGTMDGAPTVSMICDQAVVVWQDANAPVPNDIEMSDMGSLMDLSVAVFDPQTRSFSTTRLTDDSTLDQMPALGGYYAVSEEGTEILVTVAWVCSTDNAWFGNAGNNQIKRVTGRLEAGSANGSLTFVPDEAGTVVAGTGCNLMNSLAVYHNGRTPHLVWCMSSGESKGEESSLVLYEEGVPVENASAFMSGVQIVNGRRYWTELDGLYCDGMCIIPDFASDRFQILEENGVRAVLYQDVSDGLKGTVFAILYDSASSTWGSPIAVSDGECGIASFHASVGVNGIDLIINELEVIETEETKEDENEHPHQTYGAARISLYNLPLRMDLRLTSVEAETKYYDADSDFSVELTLENTGFVATDSILVRMLDQNGTELKRETFHLRLLPGETQTLPFTWFVTDYQPGVEVSFEATPVGQEDANPADNTGSLVLLYRDILLRDTGWAKDVDEQTWVFSTVISEGHETVQSLTVSLRKNAVDGPVVDTATVSGLERYVGQTVMFPVEYEEDAVYYVTIENANDPYDVNDSDYALLQEDPAYISICSLFGHIWSEEGTETAPTCTEPGGIVYTCVRCGEAKIENETPALGHQPGEPVQENYAAPTATADGGYDTVVYCQRCNAELSREHTVLPATGPVEPIENPNLRVVSNISVSTDMTVVFAARKTDVTNYERFWIEVVKHAPEGDVTYTYGDGQEAALYEGGSSWQVEFKHIDAKEMGVEVEARLYVQDASGQIYMSPAKSTNIRDYLGGRLTATNNPVSQRVLAADMLNYGAAAQLLMGYDTEHLVNEELSAEQLAKLDEYETKNPPVVEKTNSNYRPAGQSNILFNSVSLGNEVLLTLTVRAAEGNDVKVLMKDHESGAVLKTLDTVWNGGTYAVDYTDIGADKMRVAYDFTAQINGAETGNIRTWSVEGYVGELRNGSNQLQIAVANALLAYGDSAAAYFAAQ